MRVTQSMYYKNLYAQNNSQINSKLFDVNKQIASGLKIQYASDDVLTFSDTMRLDNEITTLAQIRKSTESGYKMSTQTDSILNDFTQTLNRTKTLLIQAANDTQNATSRNAIAAELRGLEDHFKNLSNTSINGQFLFSGTAVNVKPIADDGTYMGNSQSMNAFMGSGIEQTYNLSGGDLFLGEESLVKRKITTNIPQYSLTAKYPDFTNLDTEGENVLISTESTIRDLMGDTDNDATNSYGSHFYISGTRSNGDAFNEHIQMNQDETVEQLLKRIGDAFGNTPSVDLVNVKLEKNGEIVIEDKIPGSSKLSFHMVGATDFNKDDSSDAADITNGIYPTSGLIDNLNNGETDFDKIITGDSSVPNPDLYVKIFTRSDYTPSVTPSSQLVSADYSLSPTPTSGDLDIEIDNGDGTTSLYNQAFGVDANDTYVLLEAQIEADGMFDVVVNGDTITLNATSKGIAARVAIATPLSSGDLGVTVNSSESTRTPTSQMSELLYDRTAFTKEGALVSSSTVNVVKGTNVFATNSTKISEVADISKGTVSTTDDTLNATQFKLSGTTVNGLTYTAEIDLKSTANGGSTFSLDTTGDGAVDTTYDIYDLSSPRAAVDADDMTYRQLMDVVNMISTNSLPAGGSADEYDTAVANSESKGHTTLSYDGKIQFEELGTTSTKASISLYDSNAGRFDYANSSVMTFNSNNALTVSDPKTDFFKRLDEIISAVEQNKMHPDGTDANDPRNVGMSNAITMIDNLAEHVTRSQSQVGANSNSLTKSIERTTLLEVSTKVLRSSVVEVDLAEASLQLTQLSLNYEAMLATVGKISKLSLVNYL
ncbi:MAG: flagellar biosynthesis protein FlgL [Helicobacteraceae bacterium]|nr:flagellar biosynthesis protein FlgL [Candidatus Sulfurimonas ponti]